MKTLSIIVLVCLITLAAFAGINLTPPSGKVRLTWGYPTNQVSADLVFTLYTSTNLSLPLTNWLALTNTAGTNRSLDLVIQPGAHFFVLTASNFWGESLTSNVAWTPPIPLPVGNTLDIKRADDSNFATP